MKHFNWCDIFFVFPMVAYLIGVAGVLVGCGSNPPATQEVKVPVAVKCVTELPKKPEYESPRLPKDASDYDKVVAIVRDWVKSRSYEAKLEAALQACT